MMSRSTTSYFLFVLLSISDGSVLHKAYCKPKVRSLSLVFEFIYSDTYFNFCLYCFVLCSVPELKISFSIVFPSRIELGIDQTEVHREHILP